MTPLSIRQNNPGNIRPSTPPWQGVIGAGSGFCIFDTMANGIRALAKNLIAYYDSHGLNTVRLIISRWAPSNENDTAAYIASVCATCELRPDDKINVRTPDALYWLTVAIGEQESGKQAFLSGVANADIETGVYAALGQQVPA